MIALLNRFPVLHCMTCAVALTPAVDVCVLFQADQEKDGVGLRGG